MLASRKEAGAQPLKTFDLKVIELAEGAISIVYKDTLTLPSFYEFDLPVKMSPSCEISAISLGIFFPEQYLEVTGVELANISSGFNYSANDSLFLLAWSNLNPIIMTEGDTLMVLKMKTLDLSSLAGTIKLAPYELSEFADQQTNIIENVVLEVPEIEYLRPDTIDTVSGYYVRVYPNPFRDFTTVYFGLKLESKVKISVINTDGIVMMNLVDTTYPEGEYQVRLDGIDLAKGIYLLQTEIRNQELNGGNIHKILTIR